MRHDHDHDPDETLGALIARVRAQLGLTQLRLAATLCAASGAATITRNEISRWERDERIPRGFWLAWLAMALDVPLTTLERASAVSRQRRRRRFVPPPGWRLLAPGVYERVA
jgi:transcriptional regulator with XRE-family HTH domain